VMLRRTVYSAQTASVLIWETRLIAMAGTRDGWQKDCDGLILVYLPKEKVLIEADAYTPPAAFHSPHSTLILVDSDLQPQELVGQRFLTLDLPVPLPPGESAGEGGSKRAQCLTSLTPALSQGEGVLSGHNAIDTHHSCVDQGLDLSIREADFTQDLVGVGTGFWGWLPDADGRPRQPGRRSTSRHQAHRIVLSGQAQFMSGHPGVRHQLLQIPEVAMGADSRVGQACHPGVHGVAGKSLLQGLLQSLSP
jgi:hypothetical protein